MPDATTTLPVSVIVPIRNYAAYLDDCLDSVAAQTFPATEVIVVDDHSDDESTQVAQQHRLGALVVQSQGSGASAARNTGARTARGELLAFLDADDRWV